MIILSDLRGIFKAFSPFLALAPLMYQPAWAIGIVKRAPFQRSEQAISDRNGRVP